ncbi:AMP-binding protein [Porticoccaceae bacterium]|nr:AMP-binding protein [Porticoccaceae bacterium]
MPDSNLTPLPWQHIYDELNVVVPPIEDRPLGSYVEEFSVSLANSPALQYFDRTITYAELNAEANQMANALVSLGVSKGDVVGMHLINIPQYVVALVAVSKIGCAGSGVSPLMSPSELAYQVQDAGISVLLTLDDLVDNTLVRLKDTPACLKHVISCSASDHLNPQLGEPKQLTGLQCHRYLELINQFSTDFEQRPVEGNDTMMVQYTGGTTGRPKGAELSVRNLMYNPLQHGAYLPWEQGTEAVVTGFPMFHAAGLAFVIVSLRYGAQFALIPNPRDVEFMCAQMKARPPTRLAAVPSLFQMLVDTPAFKEVDFSKLKIASSGAAPLSSGDRHNIEAIIGAGKISDVFGMTETGPVHVSNPPGRSVPSSVGIPVPGADTRIVDLETGTQEMPFGEPGEIITSGPQVMKGYLNLPEESANSLRQWRGKTWMYTGDVGYMDEEGYIYLCDRAKDMLIVGGFKVFSVEVEDKMQSMDQIAMTALIGQPDTNRPGNDIVHLYVEPTVAAKALDKAELEADILAFCREHMAPYKVPKVIHIIDAIPLTAVGKIDKKALRATA